MGDVEDLRDEVERLRLRSSAATAKGGQACARLLNLAETRDSGQIRRIAQFIASTCSAQAFPVDPFDLRGLDEAIGDDMLARLDALRWGHTDLYRLIPDGEKRVQAVIAQWGLKWPAAH
jgi:hypothetical protein